MSDGALFFPLMIVDARDRWEARSNLFRTFLRPTVELVGQTTNTARVSPLFVVINCTY